MRSFIYILATLTLVAISPATEYLAAASSSAEGNDEFFLNKKRQLIDIRKWLPSSGGVLLIRRGTTTGTELEFRNRDLSLVYQKRSFPLSRRSFDIGQRDSEVVVYADEFVGTVTRASSYRRSEDVDHIGRPRPRGVCVDGVDNVMTWLEGDGLESFLAVSVFDPRSNKIITTEDAPLRVDGCREATLASLMRVPEKGIIAEFVICDGSLHLIKIALPVLRADGSIQATTVPVTTRHSLTNARAIMAHAPSQSVFIALSDNDKTCAIVRIKVDLEQHTRNQINVYEQVVFDCSAEASSILIQGIAFAEDTLYFSSYATSSVHRFSVGIHKILVPRALFPGSGEPTPTALPALPLTFLNVETVLGVGNVLPGGDFFAPGPLRIKEFASTGGRLYWLNLLDGRIQHIALLDNQGLAPYIKEEASVEGLVCPYASTFIPPSPDKSEEFPEVLISDHGKNMIRALSSEYNVDWENDARDKYQKNIAHTATAPTALFYEARTQILYWLEPQISTVVAFNVPQRHILANLTFSLDPEMTPSSFADVTYSRPTNRIYVTDDSPQHRRILSWDAPNNDEDFYVGTGTHITWKAVNTPLEFTPRAIVADPILEILYVSSVESAKIYAIYLKPHFGGQRLHHRPKPRRRHSDSKTTEPKEEPMRNLTESPKVEPFPVLYYEAPTDSLPINHLWYNDGHIHWVETIPNQDRLLTTRIMYKPLMHSNDPHAFDATKEAYVWSESTGDASRVTSALFFDVHEGILPEDSYEAASWAFSAAAVGCLATVGVCLCRQRKQLPAISLPARSLSPTHRVGKSTEYEHLQTRGGITTVDEPYCDNPDPEPSPANRFG